MELTIKINGEDKTFKQPEILMAIRFKQAVKWASAIEKDFSVETLEGAVQFIANDLYVGQFTADEFWEGVHTEDLVDYLRDALTSPMMRMQGKLEPLKN